MGIVFIYRDGYHFHIKRWVSFSYIEMGIVFIYRDEYRFHIKRWVSFSYKEMGIVFVNEWNFSWTMMSSRKKRTMNEQLGLFREMNKIIIFLLNKHLPDKIKKDIFLLKERFYCTNDLTKRYASEKTNKIISIKKDKKWRTCPSL